MAREIEMIRIVEDNQDRADAGLAYRIVYLDGHETSGPADRASMADALRAVLEHLERDPDSGETVYRDHGGAEELVWYPPADGGLEAGDYVEAGTPGQDDYDRGRVAAVDGARAVVAWVGAACRLEADVADLRPYDGEDIHGDPWPE